MIMADTRLDYDLACRGNGLIVGADGIKIDLNGHTIAGPGSGVGISVSNRAGVVISGGTVTDFLAGVQLVNSTDIAIRRNRLTGNQDAIFLIGSSGNIIKENTAWQNRRVGVMLRPSGIQNSTQNLVVEVPRLVPVAHSRTHQLARGPRRQHRGEVGSFSSCWSISSPSGAAAVRRWR